MKLPRWFARMVGASTAGEMSLFEHLDELRSMLFACLWALLLLTAAAWSFSRPILDYLVAHTVGHAQFIRPLEGFSTRMTLSLALAVIVGLPFFAAQIWGFIVPGLLQREKRYVVPIAFWSTVLFLVGVAFSTFALTPTMLRILMSFGTETIQPTIAVGYLLDFFFKMGLACGLLFQLPLVVAILSFVGLVTPQFLTAKWRHAVVIILIVAAVVTPGDGPSQLVLAVPIVILYFISIWISAAIYRGKRRRQAEDAARVVEAKAPVERREPEEARKPEAVERPTGVPGPEGGERPDDWSV
jgi:sec-independent protein translocase protein TatC